MQSLGQSNLAKPAHLAAGDTLLTPMDAPEFSSWDSARGTGQLAPPTAPLRADLAPHVARQLVEVMAQATHRPIEIALSPQELGRVRMAILTGEDRSITVSITAERPETLDLLRRNIDQLGQSFKSMGYDQISFAFGQGAQGGGQSGQDASAGGQQAPSSSSASGMAAPTADPTLITLDTVPDAGIDIRL